VEVGAVGAGRAAFGEDRAARDQRHTAAELDIDHLLPVLHREGIGKNRDGLGRLGCHRGERGNP